jgi:hypothetical protein
VCERERERERERVENGVMSYVIVTIYITRRTINIKSRGLLLSFYVNSFPSFVFLEDFF